MFYRLLSVRQTSPSEQALFANLAQWKNPRATAISFAAAVIFIFAARYLNVIRYIFKALWVTLGSMLVHLQQNTQ
jgi:hypothetical protein